MTGPSEQNDNQTALPAGTRIQHFELIKTLGRGGFGITYLAMDKKRNRKVVLKEYFPASAAIRGSQQTQVSLLTGAKEHDFNEGLRRFQREALILSEFKHPNIVEVIALFEENGTAYFVMEYIDGQSLQDLLDQRQRPLTEAEIHKDLLPVLNGLAALHAKDLLHLDIKPDNILTSDYGEPLLIDFGGARYATSQASQDHSSMVATLGYAPTEQYSLKPVQTSATDLYAFGMTLYHLMAPKQELPASGDRRDALQEDMPDPLPAIRSIASGYPDAFYRVVEHCTQTAKKDRPQTVAEVQALLPEQQDVPLTNIDRTPSPAPEPSPIPTPEPVSEPVQETPAKSEQQTPPEPDQPEPEKKKSPWLAIVAAVVLLVGGVLGYQQYQIQQEELRQAEIQRKELERQAAEAAAEAERQRQAELAKQEAERKAKAEAERKAKEAAARKAEQERQRILGLVGKLVRIPSGSFNMGSNNGRNEKPVHRVSISSFYMMEHEVTFALWDACVSDGKCERSKDRGWGRGSRPVINVSWDDITKQFIPWLNRKTGKIFRLPSESEWEYAARAGSTTKYSWGDSIGRNKANCDGCGSQWDGSKTAPVKSFSPNAFCLYDMRGNVREWTQDCWNDSYNGAPSNNRAWVSGDCDRRVLRGGSWSTLSSYLHSAYRNRGSTSNRHLLNGFRLVQAP